MSPNPDKKNPQNTPVRDNSSDDWTGFDIFEVSYNTLRSSVGVLSGVKDAVINDAVSGNVGDNFGKWASRRATKQCSLTNNSGVNKCTKWATIKCNQSTHFVKLMILPHSTNEYFVTDKGLDYEVASTSAIWPVINIPLNLWNKCYSLLNPITLANTIANASKPPYAWVVIPGPCIYFPFPCAKWKGPCNMFGSDIGNDLCNFMPPYAKELFWRIGVSPTQDQTLTQDCTLTCIFGGEFTINESGQTASPVPYDMITGLIGPDAFSALHNACGIFSNKLGMRGQLLVGALDSVLTGFEQGGENGQFNWEAAVKQMAFTCLSLGIGKLGGAIGGRLLNRRFKGLRRQAIESAENVKSSRIPSAKKESKLHERISNLYSSIGKLNEKWKGVISKPFGKDNDGEFTNINKLIADREIEHMKKKATQDSIKGKTENQETVVIDRKEYKKGSEEAADAARREIEKGAKQEVNAQKEAKTTAKKDDDKQKNLEKKLIGRDEKVQKIETENSDIQKGINEKLKDENGNVPKEYQDENGNVTKKKIEEAETKKQSEIDAKTTEIEELEKRIGEGVNEQNEDARYQKRLSDLNDSTKEKERDWLILSQDLFDDGIGIEEKLNTQEKMFKKRDEIIENQNQITDLNQAHSELQNLYKERKKLEAEKKKIKNDQESVKKDFVKINENNKKIEDTNNRYTKTQNEYDELKKNEESRKNILKEKDKDRASIVKEKINNNEAIKAYNANVTELQNIKKSISKINKDLNNACAHFWEVTFSYTFKTDYSAVKNKGKINEIHEININDIKSTYNYIVDKFHENRENQYNPPIS